MDDRDKLRVLIAEDDELMRMGLELIIGGEPDMAVAGTAANGLEALDLVRRDKPDVLLVDIQMPVMDGIACIREIRAFDPDVKILILTTFNEDEYIFQGLASGANGYLLKNIEFTGLTGTIRDAMAGRYMLPAEVAAKVAQSIVARDKELRGRSPGRLLDDEGIFTRKEREIIRLLLERLSNNEIAERALITPGTVKNHLTTIYAKLQVSSRQEAIRRLQQAADGSKPAP